MKESQRKSVRLSFRIDKQSKSILDRIAKEIGITVSKLVNYAVLMMCESVGRDNLGKQSEVPADLLCEVFHVDDDRWLVAEAVNLIRAKRRASTHSIYKTGTIHQEIKEEFERMEQDGADKTFIDEIRKRTL